MELIELCTKLISISSVSVPKGTHEIVAFLKPLFEGLDCKVKTQDLMVENHANQNLLALLGPDNQDESLVINTHLDTVTAGPYSAWTQCNENPFQATIKDGYLYGLGSADTKLAMACVFVGLQKVLKEEVIKPSKWKRPLSILGTAGEERGLIGAQHALRTQFIKGKYVIDSEPSDLKVIWAHKGFAVFKTHFSAKEIEVSSENGPFYKMTIKGEPAHSSTPHLGNNAISRSIDFLENFFQKPNSSFCPLTLFGGNAPNVIPGISYLIFQGKGDPQQELSSIEINAEVSIEKINTFNNQIYPKEFFQAIIAFKKHLDSISKNLSKKTNSEFNPPFATSSPTLLQHESTDSTISKSTLTLTQDCRYIEPGDGNHIFQDIEEFSKELSNRFPSVTIKPELERLNGPMRGDPKSQWVRMTQDCLKKIGLKGELNTKTGCTEGGLFSAAGFETIVFGPGIADNNIHKPNEKVGVFQLKKASEFYAQIIRDICL